jgi:hypothetical protein
MKIGPCQKKILVRKKMRKLILDFINSSIENYYNKHNGPKQSA